MTAICWVSLKEMDSGASETITISKKNKILRKNVVMRNFWWISYMFTQFSMLVDLVAVKFAWTHIDLIFCCSRLTYCVVVCCIAIDNNVLRFDYSAWILDEIIDRHNLVELLNAIKFGNDYTKEIIFLYEIMPNKAKIVVTLAKHSSLAKIQ